MVPPFSWPFPGRGSFQAALAAQITRADGRACARPVSCLLPLGDWAPLPQPVSRAPLSQELSALLPRNPKHEQVEPLGYDDGGADATRTETEEVQEVEILFYKPPVRKKKPKKNSVAM